jgi:CheY-like chemotaxis protein
MIVPERDSETSPMDGGDEQLIVAAIAAARARLGRAAESALMPQALDAHVLLAEDDPDNRRWLTLILECAGVRVTAVGDGQAAVEQATAAWQRQEPFGLIIMDVLMPGLDGLQATRQLRAAGYPHPIVALTACAMKGDREKCLAAGCDEYATKPIHRAALVTLVARCLLAGQCKSAAR